MESSRENYYMWVSPFAGQGKQKLYIRSCGDFTLVPPDTEAVRKVHFGEIFWPVSGQCEFLLDRKKYTLKPGNVWYYPPGSRQEFRPVTTFHYCWLTVAGENAGKLFDALGIKPGLNKAGPCPLQLFTLLEYDCNPQNVTSCISAMSTAFRILLLLTYPQSRLQIGSSMEEVKELIDTSCGNPALNTGSIAANLGMHRGSLSRAFHKTFQVTVSEYISLIRLQRAEFMLEKTSLTIKEIAESCGFTSPNYFSKVFLAKKGVSPQKFRQKFLL